MQFLLCMCFHHSHLQARFTGTITVCLSCASHSSLSDSWIPAAVTTVTFLRCRVQVCPFLQRSSVLDQGHKPYTTNQASELDRGNLSLAPTPYSALVKHLRCSERMSILWHTTTLPKFPLSQNCPSLFGKLLDKLSLVSPTTLQTKSNCKHIHSSRV